MDTSIILIGEIHSSLNNLDECPLQEVENAPEATLLIFPEYIKGIKDIKEGSQRY